RKRSFRHWDTVEKRSICNGDSGGPALFKVKGVETLIGVSSVVEEANPDPHTNFTLCDAAGVSTRIDTNIAFLEPIMRRYNTEPQSCLATPECTSCELCTAKQCQPDPKIFTTKQCQPCAKDQDCGQDGKCIFTSVGFRCIEPCNEQNCFHCAEGHTCKVYEQTRKSYCQPNKEICPAIPCQKDDQCGPAERCINNTCTLQRPKRIPRLCYPCKNHDDCSNGFCYGATDGFGYCVQACSPEGICPSDFRCAQLTPGNAYCLPERLCQMSCSPSSPCPQGYTCNNQNCTPNQRGKDGAFCNRERPCADGYQCLVVSTSNRFGRCIERCPTSGTIAGNPCGTNQQCAPGLTCKGNRMPACMEECTVEGQPCTNGGTCITVQSGVTVCLCSSDRDCNTDQYCNINRWSSLDLGGCVDRKQYPRPSCSNGKTCQTLRGQGPFCHSSKRRQRPGALCDASVRCRPGATCVGFGKQPLCVDRCTEQNLCPAGGTCKSFGSHTKLCTCTQDDECPSNHRCKLLSHTPRIAVCQPRLQAPCNNDKDCFNTQQCMQGQCIPRSKPIDPAPENNTEPTVPEREPIPEETITESPTSESSTSEVPTPTQESDSGDASEPKATTEERAQNAKLNLSETGLSAGCGCAQSTSSGSSALLWILLLGLFALCQRMRTSQQ
ncbi:MAG: hypothetical protein AAGJ35_05545, partial [Myxococcota bacterium]